MFSRKISCLSAPAPSTSFTKKSTVLATSGSGNGMVMGQGPFDSTYFLKGALAGGVCCSITHGALCPVDVVKTRIQLDPVKYNSGMIGGFKTVIAEEGMAGLATGLGPTVLGYFVQGWFKFGGVEFFKINFTRSAGEQKAWDNRMGIYLASAAIAETIADIFLCPLEATRIRLVSDPSYASGLLSGFSRIKAEEGILKGFYSGFGPILMKQVPYTCAKFVVQGAAAEVIAKGAGVQDLQTASGSTKMAVAISSGITAGVAAAIISHPADTLLSLVNKEGAGGEGGIMTRLGRIAAEVGPAKLCLVGLGPRCVMIGTLTAGQFAIFDTIMELTGATKFHFHDPSSH
jgi:solute carrier family 25 phosphate transporter 3